MQFGGGMGQKSFYDNVGEKPWRNRMEDPPITVYLISADTPDVVDIFCMFCRRPLMTANVAIDKMIGTPMPVVGFNCINVRCKLCKMHWRFMLAQ